MMIPPPSPPQGPPPVPPPPGRIGPPSGQGPRGWVFWTWVVIMCGWIIALIAKLLGAGR